jgi:hypothetical protein
MPQHPASTVLRGISEFGTQSLDATTMAGVGWTGSPQQGCLSDTMDLLRVVHTKGWWVSVVPKIPLALILALPRVSVAAKLRP